MMQLMSISSIPSRTLAVSFKEKAGVVSASWLQKARVYEPIYASRRGIRAMLCKVLGFIWALRDFKGLQVKYYDCLLGLLGRSCRPLEYIRIKAEKHRQQLPQPRTD